MPRSALPATIAQAVIRGLAPLLHEDGFKKRGTNFYHLGTQSNQLVFVQSSQWNTSSSARFTIELGLYFPAMDAVAEQIWTKPGAEPWVPKIHNCQLRKRIGFLLPVQRDYWWTVVPSANVDDLAVELAETWRKYGAPWMRIKANLPEAANQLEADSLFLSAAQARLALGERADASRLAKQFVASQTEGTPHPATAAIIEKRLIEIREWCARHQLQL